MPTVIFAAPEILKIFMIGGYSVGVLWLLTSTFANDHFELFGLRQGLKMGNFARFVWWEAKTSHDNHGSILRDEGRRDEIHRWFAAELTRNGVLLKNAHRSFADFLKQGQILPDPPGPYVVSDWKQDQKPSNWILLNFWNVGDPFY